MSALAEMPIVVEAPACTHADFSTHAFHSSPFDDHSTSAGQCRSCLEWCVVTEHSSGRVESRAMSDAERRALQGTEDRYRRGDAS